MKMSESTSNTSFMVSLVGSFEPTFFHPRWLFGHGDESNGHETSVLIENFSSEFAKFNFLGVNYYVTKNFFQISKNQLPMEFERIPWEILLEKLKKIFSELENSTTVTRGSLYRCVHIELKDGFGWKKINNYFTPTEFWKEIGVDFDSSRVNQHGNGNPGSGQSGGLKTIRMQSFEDTETMKLSKEIILEPSYNLSLWRGLFTSMEFSFINGSQPINEYLELLLNEHVKRNSEFDKAIEMLTLIGESNG